MHVPLPAPLRMPSASPFVGRAAELAALRALQHRTAADGLAAVAVVAGDAGTGKSRLVGELARALAAEDVAVLLGDSQPDLVRPYGPWADALGHLARHAPAEVLRALAGDLAPLGLTRDGAAAPDADPDAVRHRLHAAVGDLLADVSLAPRGPALVVVLEDVHWADRESVRLLRHLARTPLEARLLLLLTVRDAEVPEGSELALALAGLRRREDALRLRLRGPGAEGGGGVGPGGGGGPGGPGPGAGARGG